jgi:hypothetical protein
VGQTGSITVSVSDGQTSVSLPTFSINVANVNDAPVIGGTPSTFVPKNSAYSFTPTISDPDGDALTFSVTNKPVWASFDISTGSLTGTPGVEYLDTTTENIVISASDGHLTNSLPAFSIAVTTAPLILYTDIVSGPNSGGENNQGAYLSIFGLYFGDTSSIGSTTKVFINDVEVAAYKYMGMAKSQFLGTDQPIQQISVQIGSIGNPTPGVALPIRVQVNGVPSNTDYTFIVQPGDVLYVDNVNGNDATAVKNDISQPWRYVQTAANVRSGAVASMQAGDTIVMRGGSWNDVGWNQNFLKIANWTGTAPNGIVGNGYLTILGYPGEDVRIVPQPGTNGGIHGTSSVFASLGRYVQIANLRIEGGDRTVGDGPINLQSGSDYWRIVNNELFNWDAESVDSTTTSQARAGGIAGNGQDVSILGNHIHHIDGGTLNHGIYLDGGARIEVAYNHIHDTMGGNIIQTFGSTQTDIRIHHNLLHDGNRYGLNIADGSDLVYVWNNVVYNTDYSGLRLVVGAVSDIGIYHNTFYNVCRLNRATTGAINNDQNNTGGHVEVRNNVVHANAVCSSYYVPYANDGGLTLNNNLYVGLSMTYPSQDLNAITADPLLRDPVNSDFHLSSVSSPAVDAATALTTPVPDDFGFLGRPKGSYPDIGAFEYGLEP